MSKIILDFHESIVYTPKNAHVAAAAGYEHGDSPAWISVL